MRPPNPSRTAFAGRARTRASCNLAPGVLVLRVHSSAGGGLYLGMRVCALSDFEHSTVSEITLTPVRRHDGSISEIDGIAAAVRLPGRATYQPTALSIGQSEGGSGSVGQVLVQFMANSAEHCGHETPIGALHQFARRSQANLRDTQNLS